MITLYLLFFLKQEGGLIRGTVLVVVVEGVGVVEATLAMTTMVEAGVVVAVATVEAGLITLAVAVVDGAQVAVVALLGVLVVPAEEMLLDGVELAVTATVVVAVEAPGEQRSVVPTVVEVEGGGEQLLVAQATQDGAAPKRPYQHRMVGAAGDLAVAVVAALTILDGEVPKRLYQHRMVGTVVGPPAVAVAGDEFVLHACCVVVHQTRTIR